MRGKKRASTSSGGKMGRIGDRPYWVLNLSIMIRAVHQIGVAVFLASYLLEEVGYPSTFYIWLAFGSGLALIFTEWLRHREIWREFSGVATMVKIILVGAAFHGFLPIKITMLIGFIIASVSAHAPKLIRHRLLF